MVSLKWTKYGLRCFLPPLGIDAMVGIYIQLMTRTDYTMFHTTGANPGDFLRGLRPNPPGRGLEKEKDILIKRLVKDPSKAYMFLKKHLKCLVNA